jgi:hypothetical protein
MAKKSASRATRAERKAANYLSHKAVPYVHERSGADVNKFLPSHAHDALTATRVAQFVEETRLHPDTRMAVLGILRSHASNGPEVPLSAFALMASAIAILTASQDDVPYFGWIVGIGFVIAAAYVGRISVVVHLRRTTSIVWLGAYEDAIAHGGAGGSPFRWRRRCPRESR